MHFYEATAPGQLYRESLECQEWLLISTVLWEAVANPWLCRTWQLCSSCCSSLPWPMSTSQIPPMSPFLQPSLGQGRAGPMGATLCFSFGFSSQGGCTDSSGTGTPHSPPFPGPVQPQGQGQLSLSTPSCRGHTAHNCWDSSGSTAKPAVTGYWAPTNVCVLFTAHTEVPHGLQAVFSWLRARRETTPAAWWTATSSPAVDRAGQEHICFSFVENSWQGCINFISASHRNIFPLGSTWGKDLQMKTLSNVQPWKNPNQIPDVAQSTGIFPWSIFPVDPEQIQAFLQQQMTSTTFAPSRILLADLQILLQRFLIFSLPWQKRLLGLAKVWWAEQTEKSKCSWIPRWSQLTSWATNWSAVQTSGKQTIPIGGGLWANLNYLGRRIPSEPLFFLTECQLKNCNGRKVPYCAFYTEAAIIQKHKFEVIQKLFHNPSNSLLNPLPNLVLSFKNVSEKKLFYQHQNLLGLINLIFSSTMVVIKENWIYILVVWKGHIKNFGLKLFNLMVWQD